MRNFKNVLKTLATVIAFILVTALLGELVCAPYLYGSAYYYQDGRVRDDLSGTLDLLIVGASQAQRGISPAVLDKELGCNSYNLSTPLLSMEGKYLFLKKELARNPVDTVIIELCYDTMMRERDEVGPEGDYYALARFTNPFERYCYFFATARLGEYGQIFNETINRSVKSFERVEAGDKNIADRNYEHKGFYSLWGVPIEPPAEADRFKEAIETELGEENLKYFNKTVDLCNEYGADVIVVSTPLSNGAILSYDALDTVNTLYSDMCAAKGVTFCNYSLYRGKTELFPEQNAYYDRNHLSDTGAVTFSELVADTVTAVKSGEDISYLFYDSYKVLCEQEIYMSISPKTGDQYR